MTEPILTPGEARALRMKPLTTASDLAGVFIRNVCRDMRRVPGTRWAIVRPETRQAQDSPSMVEVWRVMIPLT